MDFYKINKPELESGAMDYIIVHQIVKKFDLNHSSIRLNNKIQSSIKPNNKIQSSIKPNNKLYSSIKPDNKIQSSIKPNNNPKENQKKILKDVNLNIKKGETYCIIGPNGSGKTTLLRILALLIPPSSGSINIFGFEIDYSKNNKLIAYRKNIGFVRQKPVVLDDSVFNNLALPLKFRGLSNNQISEKVQTMLKQYALEKFKDTNAKTLSGGEMQRVAIAMNLIYDPPILIFDEVFSNLDASNQKLVKNILLQQKNNPSKTIIFATHNKEEAIRYSDRIGVLIDGKILQEGTPSEIFKNPANSFIAEFLGFENIFSGYADKDEKSGMTKIETGNGVIYSAIQRSGPLKVCIRPESIIVTLQQPQKISTLNKFEGVIKAIRNKGLYSLIEIRRTENRLTNNSVVNEFDDTSSNNNSVIAAVTNTSVDKLELVIGKRVFYGWKATDVLLL